MEWLVASAGSGRAVMAGPGVFREGGVGCRAWCRRVGILILTACKVGRSVVKVKASVRRICNACQIVRRKGKVRVICKAEPKHKQVQG